MAFAFAAATAAPVAGRTDTAIGRDPTRPPADCAKARIAIAGGTPIDEAMVERGPCDGPVRRLGYDRVRRVPVARGDVPAGTNLGSFRIRSGARIAAGQAVTLRTRTGPVTIERRVVTLQPGRPGGRVFVMTEGGAVLSSRLAATAR